MPETTTTIENGQGGCCICCKAGTKTCYCGCCPCVPDGDLTFSVLDCNITYGGVTYPNGCGDCAEGWTFTLTKRDTECMVHTRGISNDSPDIGAITCSPCSATEYTGTPRPTPPLPLPLIGTEPYPEAWGFSGTVCDNCETSDDFESDECDGMALRASLCCCKTGIPEGSVVNYPLSEHPCPMVTASNCNTVEDSKCSMDCFWFGMSTWEKYDIDGDGVKDSPCSNCAAVQTSFGPLVPGSLFGGEGGTCFGVTSGQCSSLEDGVWRPFMIAVTGSFMIACDCQTGLIGHGFGGTITSYDPVLMQITALIHE